MRSALGIAPIRRRAFPVSQEGMPAQTLSTITITLDEDERERVRRLHERTGVKTTTELGRMGLRALETLLDNAIDVSKLADKLGTTNHSEAA